MKNLIVGLASFTLVWVALTLAQTFPPPSGPGAAAVSYGVKALTETTATDFFTIDLPDGDVFGARVFGTIRCSDGTDEAARTQDWYISCYNDSVLDCYVDIGSDYSGMPGGVISAYTMSFSTGTDQVTFTMNSTCSLTQTTLDWHWRVEQPPTLQKTVHVE
jgi:hypothetical protein